MANPLLESWNTPYGLPPFDRIETEHYLPAFLHAMHTHRAEVNAIAENGDPPTFDNTIAALDRSGRELGRIERLFFNLTASETSADLQAIERDISPQLAAHYSAISMDSKLFTRIETVHERRGDLPAESEERRLLERIHLDFVREGALLSPSAKTRYAAIMERLAELTTRFMQNVLADETDYRLPLVDERDFAGLPDYVRAAAREAAAGARRRHGRDRHAVPFAHRAFPHVLGPARPARAGVQGVDDARRARRGARQPADRPRDPGACATSRRGSTATTITRTMRSSTGWPARPTRWPASSRRYGNRPRPARRRSAMRCRHWPRRRERPTRSSPGTGATTPKRCARRATAWTIRLLKPYFSLERMLAAAFDTAHRLFGLSFVPRPDIVTYHPDVRVFEVRGADDKLIGIFLSDNFARPNKRGGAWMNAYRWQSRTAGDTLPIVVNNNNFAKGPSGTPTLLSADDVRTLFHEFGHGLHGLLSQVTYERLSGTHVLRDFVELPSQLFEHWAFEPAVLRRHALHHATGKPIPDELIERLKEARRFNQGFETVEYTASALIDMALHADPDPAGVDITAFERAELQRIGMPREILPRHRLPHFGHLFASAGYAAGYYVYLWAEVLDADGYDAFLEAGDPFDPAVAERVRRYVYSSGGTLPPAAAYRAFRGRDPRVEPLLAQRGLAEAPQPA